GDAPVIDGMSQESVAALLKRNVISKIVIGPLSPLVHGLIGRLQKHRLPGRSAMDAAQPFKTQRFSGRKIPVVGLLKAGIFDPDVEIKLIRAETGNRTTVR